tara:strand:+ start:271 stop:603 length:333 start_codon:yes stop_codon:yes gene_type:complete
MKTTYYVAIHTGATYDQHEYAEQAGLMANLTEAVFTDVSTLAAITNNAPLTACAVESEISHEDCGLEARVVLDFEAPTRVALLKSKLSQKVRTLGHWPTCKIEKHVLPED